MGIALTFQVLTPQEVADCLQIGVRQVYKWIQDGELPAVRLGRVYRVQQDDLRRFLLERKTVRRGAMWKDRFDQAMEASQQAFRGYLQVQGLDPDRITDEEAERILRDASRD